MSSGAPPATVLLVDDNEDFNFIHERLLHTVSPDIQVFARQYAEGALELLASEEGQSVDLVLLDINMPKMTGFEFVDKLSTIRPSINDDIVVVMVSTTLNPDDFYRADQSPYIVRMLEKPLTQTMLADLLDEHLPVADAADTAR
ncbi:MAG: response regulator [Pseudomonadota bacterium]